MSYATQQDMIDRFGSKELIELTDHSNLGTIDATVLGRALDDASSEIDGYLATSYTLPLTTIPTVINRLAADMARFYLCGDRVTTAAQARYTNAIAFLRAVANGTVTLGVDATGVKAPEEGGALTSAATRVFTQDSLGDY